MSEGGEFLARMVAALNAAKAPHRVAARVRARRRTQGATVRLEVSVTAGSARQLRDVAGVLAVQRGALDLADIERWAMELGVLDRWRTLREA